MIAMAATRDADAYRIPDRGSTATNFSSEWPHFRHSTVRCSKPSGPSTSAVVTIRI
jgi:hypothetical protein